MHHKLLLMYAKQPMENIIVEHLLTISPMIEVELMDHSKVNMTTPLKINNAAVQKVMRMWFARIKTKLQTSLKNSFSPCLPLRDAPSETFTATSWPSGSVP